MSVSAVPTHWRRPLVLLLLALVVVGWLYRATGMAMIDTWDRSATFAHAWVVPPIALWLIWRQRAVLAPLQPRPDLRFLLPLAAAGALWLVGEMAAANSATQLALVAMLVLCVPIVLGWPVTRAIAFPLGFLFFAVPIGDFLLPQLMSWTADFTVTAVRLSGVPLYREGMQFVIPSGTWSVVEACSGIRYLIASVMVGALFAYLNYRSLKRRWIFVGVAVLLPLVANWVRAYMIVMLGHLSDNRIATGVDHLIYGWVFFGIVMLALFLIGARWAEPDEVHEAPAATPLTPVARPGALQLAAPALLGLLIAAPALSAHWLDAQQPEHAPRLATPELSAGGWLPANLPAGEFKPLYGAPAAEIHTGFAKAGSAPVGLYVAYYRRQSFDSKLVSSDNVLVRPESQAWSAVQHGALTTDGRTLRTTVLRGNVLGAGSDPRLHVAQAYWIDGQWTTSDLTAKALGLLERLRGRGDDGAAVILYTNELQPGGGEQALATFLHDNGPALDTWLRAVGARAVGEN